ncbi:enoyl-ACP reductase FabI [Namhaeicola litoreus]|uniref:Enoyl-ACP reductase n=1 Tax=Namhaeicola litoreus TaxID=1052145 RepID=A0ABW3Y6L7_9FLAO
MVREFEHKNFWAIILGGSRGLGLASALKLAEHGMNICIIHRDRRTDIEKINKYFEQIKNENVQFISFNLDGLKSENILLILESLKEKMGENGKVKTFIHSVAKGHLKAMVHDHQSTLTNEDFLITLNAMAISLYDWTKAIFTGSLFSSDARILAFTSEGNSKAWPNYGAVSAAKAALEAISRNIALEFAPFGLRSNCIQAGVTDTASFKMIPNSDSIKEFTRQRNPFKRLTTPIDVANVVYLLCKEEAAWINGTVIPVNGGEHIN